MRQLVSHRHEERLITHSHFLECLDGEQCIVPIWIGMIGNIGFLERGPAGKPAFGRFAILRVHFFEILRPCLDVFGQSVGSLRFFDALDLLNGCTAP